MTLRCNEAESIETRFKGSRCGEKRGGKKSILRLMTGKKFEEKKERGVYFIPCRWIAKPPTKVLRKSQRGAFLGKGKGSRTEKLPPGEKKGDRTKTKGSAFQPWRKRLRGKGGESVLSWGESSVKLTPAKTRPAFGGGRENQ